MYTLITVVAIVLCAFIVLVVLVQNSKGGGFASGMGGVSTQIMGARKSADFLEKLTWGLAISLLAVCMLANFALPGKGEKANASQLKDKIENYSAPVSNMPALPKESPAEPAK